jgi:hypothetical protein
MKKFLWAALAILSLVQVPRAGAQYHDNSPCSTHEEHSLTSEAIIRGQYHQAFPVRLIFTSDVNSRDPRALEDNFANMVNLLNPHSNQITFTNDPNVPAMFIVYWNLHQNDDGTFTLYEDVDGQNLLVQRNGEWTRGWNGHLFRTYYTGKNSDISIKAMQEFPAFIYTGWPCH